MYEKFPDKRRGDYLTANHVNTLGSVCGRFGRARSGSFLNMRNSGDQISIAGSPNGMMFIAEISNKKIHTGDTDDSGMYLIKVRWYSHQTGKWNRDEDKEWMLDASGLGDSGSFSVGDTLVVFWDDQRAMFIPSASKSTVLVPCVLTEDLHSGESASAFLLVGSNRDQQSTSVVVYDIPAFISPGYMLTDGSRLRILWDTLISKWVFITTNACEVEIDVSESSLSSDSSSISMIL